MPAFLPRRAVALAFLLIAVPAAAEPGDHIRVGDAVITPSLTVGADLHTNVYLTDVDPEWAPDLTVSPKIHFDLDRPDFQTAFGIGYSARGYIDPDPEDAAHIANLNQFNNVDGSAGVNILRRAVLGFRADDHFQVTNTPAELATATGSANIVTTSNDLTGGVLVRPGSAIEIGGFGLYGFDGYNVPPGFSESTEAISFNNRASYGPRLDASWRFLPRTSLKGSTSVAWNKWDNNLIRAAGPEAEGLDYGQYLGKPDSLAWRTMWGVKGQWTSKISAELSLGYGQMYYDEQTVLDSAQAAALPASSNELDLIDTSPTAENFARDLRSFREGSLVLAQISWQALPKQTFNLGYRKDFQDAFFTNYVAFNYVYARYEGTVYDHLKLNGEVGLRVDAFHGEVARKDANWKAMVSGSYEVTTFTTVSLTGGWTERACGNTNCQSGSFETTEYDDFYGSAAVTFTY